MNNPYLCQLDQKKIESIHDIVYEHDDYDRGLGRLGTCAPTARPNHGLESAWPGQLDQNKIKSIRDMVKTHDHYHNVAWANGFPERQSLLAWNDEKISRWYNGLNSDKQNIIDNLCGLTKFPQAVVGRDGRGNWQV